MEIRFEHMLVSEQRMKEVGASMRPYIDELVHTARTRKDGRGEYAITTPFDHEALKAVLDMKSKTVNHALKYVVVVGIGGSNLGSKAIYDSLRGHFDVLEPASFPKMLFADTCDPEWLARFSSFLEHRINSPEEVLVVLVTKSGTTIETMFNGEFLMKLLTRQFGAVAKERLVVITAPENKFWEWAGDHDIKRLSIPLAVGGRYSIFTAAGLFPLAAAGFDIRALLEGAQSMREHCLSESVTKNSAARSAIGHFLHYQAGVRVADMFVFHPELESLGKWNRQLLAECLGKEHDLDGKEVRIGLLPTVSVGSVDLHATGQQYFGGPKNRLTTFVWSSDRRNHGLPVANEFFKEHSAQAAGKTADELMAAILQGVEEAYQKSDLPFVDVVLPGINEYSLGQFMMWKMVEIMYLGKLLNVNAFDQPGVEMYKKEVERILRNS